MRISYIGKCLLIEQENKKREKTLAIGDLHLGYEEELERAGIGIGRESFNKVIKDLEGVFNEVGKVDKLVLLGDVKHGFSRGNMQEWQDVLKLIKFLREKLNEKGRIIVIKGNHDNYIQNILKKEEVNVYEYFINNGICFLHGDADFKEIYGKEIKYWIIGHAHPAIVLMEKKGVKREKYKCFLIGGYKDKKVIILPSFFPLVEGSDILTNKLNLPWKININELGVLVVEGTRVLDFGKVGKLR